MHANYAQICDEQYRAWSDVSYLGNNDPSFIDANQLIMSFLV